MKKLSIAAAALCLGATAQESQSTSKNIEEAITVTATGAKRSINSVPMPVRVITREEIENSNASFLPEVLKNTAGIAVTKVFGHPSSYRVDLRGFGEVSAANTLVTVDGRPMNRSDLAEINWTSIPLDRIERIEVVRGGRSVLYGDNAVAGVISIFTKGDPQQDKEPTITARSRFGSFNTHEYSLSISGAKDGVAYFVDSGFYETDGFRDNNFFRSKSTSFGILYDDGGDWSFDIKGGWSESKTGFPGTRPNGGKETDASSNDDHGDTREHYATIAPTYHINKDVSLNFDVDVREYEASAEFFGASSRFRMQDVRFSPNIVIDSEGDGFSNRLIVGVDHAYAQKKQLKANFISAEGDKAVRRSTGAYLFNSISLLDDSLHIDAGYRRERIRYTSNTDAFSEDHHDLNAGSFGITWNYNEDSKVFASYDRSFRTVRVDELGGPAFNQMVDPQRSHTYQIGIDHQLCSKASIAATLFRIETKNEIFYDPTLGFFGQNESYEETLRNGFEIEFDYQPTEDLSVYANYTYTDGELKGDAPLAGNDIPDVAAQKANAGFIWQFVDSMRWGMNVNWLSARQPYGDFESALDEQPSQITMDTKVTWDINKYVSVYAGVNNLFDEEYNEIETEFGDYPGAGMNTFGGLDFTYQF